MAAPALCGFVSRAVCGVVHDHWRLEKGDLRGRSIALGDHLLPLGSVHPLGGFTAFPEVDATSRAVLAEEVVLTDEPRSRSVSRSRPFKERLRVIERGAGGEREANDCGEHLGPLRCRWAYSSRAAAAFAR